MKKRAFRPGSLVRLASGGPVMTVAGWRSSDELLGLQPAGWRCRWMSSQSMLCEGVFAECELQAAPADQQAADSAIAESAGA